MSKVLVVAEHANAKLNRGTAKVLAAARLLDDNVDVAVLSNDGTAVSSEAAALEGVAHVLQLDRAENQYQVAAVLAPQIMGLLERGYTHVLAPGTTFGKDLLPRVAAVLGVPQVSDVMMVRGPTSFDRAIYAGNAVVTVEVPSTPCVVATVRLASFSEVRGSGRLAPIEKIACNLPLPRHTRALGLKPSGGDRPDLQSASRVISGGRGVGSAEKFELIYKIADKLGAAVGASRAAVDSGYVSNDLQVGQTGKIIAPDLYLAIGISGAIQHIAGIKDAGTIVAINSDPEAPIFEIADFGLVGDLFQVLPELESKL